MAEAILSGWLTFYGPGVMEGVAVYRGLPTYGRLAATTDCRDIGHEVWLAGPYGWEDFMVVDCGVFLTPHRIAEVDYATAIRWHMIGPIPGALRRTNPAEDCALHVPC